MLVPIETLPTLDVVGSHCLGRDYELDVDGDAAALDVYAFLKIEYEGKTLLALSEAGDPDWAVALSTDANTARDLMSAFAGLTQPREGLASHTFAKQVYWLLPDRDPHDDTNYHLLAPLHPSSLIHRFYGQLQEDRFGEAAKAAREARREGRYVDQPQYFYPNLGMRKLGGTKPLNVSQLNSERRGENLLLASLPPKWLSEPVRPLLRVEDMFKVFNYREQVRQFVRQLRSFLEADPAAVLETREHRAGLVDLLVGEFIQFTAELRDLPEGWSQEAECRLGEAEKCWLDAPGVPEEERLPIDSVTERIAAGFANWLNAQLRGKLDFADPEFREWRDCVLEEVRAYDMEVSYE